MELEGNVLIVLILLPLLVKGGVVVFNCYF